MITMKLEIASRETIKPSSPASHHHETFKLCLLDQLAPPIYVPLVLFYSAADFSGNDAVDHTTISDRLKKSLSKTLSHFYPLCGRMKENASVECNDEGVLYVEARPNVALSDILKNPEISVLEQFLPFDPYRVRLDKEAVITAIQVNVFDCGGIGIGVCMLHKIADGATVASFINAWAATASGADETIKPHLDSASLFPPRDINVVMPSGVISKEKLATRRFEFNGTNLALLKAKAAFGNNPTRVEAVTALIWKSAIAAAKANSGTDRSTPSTILTHVVNFRGRMVPPLPDHSVGNLWQFAVATLMEEKEKEKEKFELHDLACLLRKSIKKIDGDYLRELQGDDGLAKACESLKEVRQMASKGEVELFRFSSWTRFPFYEADFGWGKPIWVCTTSVPIKNCVILMGTRCGDGIEAWVSLAEHEMAQFERNHELLQFVSSSPTS